MPVRVVVVGEREPALEPASIAAAYSRVQAAPEASNAERQAIQADLHDRAPVLVR